MYADDHKKEHLGRRKAYGLPRERRLRSINEALSALFDKEEYRRQRFIAALWQNWKAVLGEDISGIAFPLGHKDATLLIGAEDNMAMQELSLQSTEILERVNAFMDEEFFSRVKVVLLLGQRPINPERPGRPITPLRPAFPQRPPGLGGLSGVMDQNSLVGQCYKAYVAMFIK